MDVDPKTGIVSLELREIKDEEIFKSLVEWGVCVEFDQLEPVRSNEEALSLINDLLNLHAESFLWRSRRKVNENALCKSR